MKFIRIICLLVLTIIGFVLNPYESIYSFIEDNIENI
jgi:hypothetical protein